MPDQENAAPARKTGTKNKLADLNDHLFMQLERLGDEMSAETIEQECTRTAAIVSVAEAIVRNVDVQLKAANLIATHGDRFKPMLPMLASKSE